MENTSLKNDSFYHEILLESQGRIDTDNLEMKVSDLQVEIRDLTLKLQRAESESKTHAKELEISSSTIQDLKTAGTKHLKDRDIAAMHLKLKSEQVVSLKNSIEAMKSSLEEVLEEKADIL